MEESLKTRLCNLISDNFPKARIELEVLPNDRITGMILWEGFSEIEPAERQDRLWSNIESAFEKSEILSISTLLTVAPHEVVDDEAA